MCECSAFCTSLTAKDKIKTSKLAVCESLKLMCSFSDGDKTKFSCFVLHISEVNIPFSFFHPDISTPGETTEKLGYKQD